MHEEIACPITCDVIERTPAQHHVRRVNPDEANMSYQSRDRHPLNPLELLSTATPRTLRSRMALQFAVWRERVAMRRSLAQMDARSLRDAGISPAAAAYESGKPFWQRVGHLR